MWVEVVHILTRAIYYIRLNASLPLLVSHSDTVYLLYTLECIVTVIDVTFWHYSLYTLECIVSFCWLSQSEINKWLSQCDWLAQTELELKFPQN